MSSSFTIAQLEELKAKGFIQGYSPLNPSPEEAAKGKKKGQLPAKGSKIKGWISMQLFAWCKAEGFTLSSEFQFHPERKWRFDWCVMELKVGVEYEGLMSEKSRHTTVRGFTGDAEKYKEAMLLGWKVFRYTALNYKTIIQDLEKVKRG